MYVAAKKPLCLYAGMHACIYGSVYLCTYVTYVCMNVCMAKLAWRCIGMHVLVRSARINACANSCIRACVAVPLRIVF